jgi:TrmH family RNA methyltransferase
VNERTIRGVERISSRHNPIVKRFRALRAGSAGGAVLLDGAHLIQEALASGVDLEVVAVEESAAVGPLAAMAAGLVDARVRTILVTPPVLAAMSPVREPTGIVAAARLPAAPLDALLGARAPLLVVLHEVQDPGNVGATVRAAEAFGATGVIATTGSADPFGWKSLRASMGSALRVRIAAAVPAIDLAAALAARQLPVLAAVPRDGTPLPAADLSGPLAILLGGEGAGLPADLAARADVRVSIPMRPPVESLNVAVAASLILYEAARQRG